MSSTADTFVVSLCPTASSAMWGGTFNAFMCVTTATGGILERRHFHVERRHVLVINALLPFNVRLFRGELAQAALHAEEISHLGRFTNEPMWECMGSLLSGHVCFWLGRFIDAHDRYQDAPSLWDPKFRAVATSPVDPYIAILLYASRALFFLGYLEQVRLRRCEAPTESRRLSPYNRGFALAGHWVGDWTIEDANEPLALAKEQGFAFWGAIGTLMRGWCLSARGLGAEGVPLMLQGLARLARHR